MAILLDPLQGRGSVMQGTLAVVPVTGGTPREILEDTLEADWTPDGRTLCVTHQTREGVQIEFPPGTPVYRSARGVHDVRVSRNGRLVAFTEGGSLIVLDLATRVKTILVESLPYNSYGLAWSASGKELWLTEGSTGGARDIVAVDLRGHHRLVHRSAGVVSMLDVAPDGRVLLHRSTDFLNVVARFAGTSEERDVSVSHSFIGPLSADGRRLLINEISKAAGRGAATYLQRAEGGDPIRLGDGYRTDLSADGRSALIVDGAALVEVPLGAGVPRPVNLGSIRPSGARYLPPPGTGMVVAALLNGEPHLWLLDGPGIAPRLLGPGTPRIAVSPDGRWLATMTKPGMLTLIPLKGGEPRAIGGLSADFWPIRFSGDGRSIFLGNGRRGPCEIHRLDLATDRPDLLQTLAPADRAGFGGCMGADVSADGRSHAYGYWRSLTDLVVAEGLR